MVGIRFNNKKLNPFVNMKIFISVLLFIFSTMSIASQNIVISGYVEDKNSSEKLINAIIRSQNNKYVVTSNDFGYFAMNVTKNDTLTIIATYIGYKPQSTKIICNKNTEITLKLTEQNDLREVTIYANKPINGTFDISSHNLSINQLKSLPSLGGEKDILKAIQLLPGIQTGNEGSNGLFIRGGNIDENLILLDGVPIYNVNHIGGFISIFNSDAIKSAKIIKGGFPAKYGGRLSSVIDISLKDGNLNKLTGNFSISPITSNISINGPIKKSKSSFIISIRTFYLGLLTRPITFLQFSGTSLGYNFHDINVKLNYKLNKKNKIFFSFFEGQDKYISTLNNVFIRAYQQGHSSTSWGNLLFAFRWNHNLKPNLFSNITIANTKYNYKTENNYYDDYEYLFNFSTQISNIIVKSDFNWSLSQNSNIKFGTNHVIYNFTPGQTHFFYKTSNNQIDTTYNYQKEFALENNLYFQFNNKLNEIVSTNIGVRLTDYFVKNKNFFSIEPRILILIKIFKNSAIKSSYAENQQNIHVISSSSASLPMDIWTTSNSNIPPSKSKQATIGYYQTLLNNKFKLSIESYYKHSTNLATFKEGATYLSVIDDWTDKLETNGIGKSYGLELFFEKKQGKTTGWLSFTISKATRLFKNINYGKEYPFKYDRRNNISFVLIHKFSKKITFSMNWIYGSGYPYTLPIARYNFDYNVFSGVNIPSTQAIIYANRNEYRMRDYHRLDLALNFNKEKKRGTRTWSLNIYNAYNRQ
ncbi:MAG: TonB-dependent receptor plug domain-containing protein, partial [Bacteroidota bacterium]|nr:TonB-dependent receptor plug domain-containing protein [Bacteroidota bacterium]